MKKIILTMLFVMAVLTLVSATPQVFFTDINITINNGTLSIRGEGITASDTINVPNVTGCSISYERNKIPITITREIGENNTDVAVLIRALAGNNNITHQWQECVKLQSELNSSLNVCNIDRGYKDNYTVCNNQLIISSNAQQTYTTQIGDKNKEIEQIKQQRLIFGGIALVCAYLAWHYNRKGQARTTRGPVADLPSTSALG